MASGITSTRIVVASTAELQAAVAKYTAQGFQLKAMTDTTASLEKMRSAYKAGTMAILLVLCIIPREPEHGCHRVVVPGRSDPTSYEFVGAPREPTERTVPSCRYAKRAQHRAWADRQDHRQAKIGEQYEKRPQIRLSANHTQHGPPRP